MKIFNNTKLAFLILFFSMILFEYSVYRYELSSISNDNTLKEVIIEPGSIDSIATTLKKEHLIRSTFVFKLYIHLSGKTNLKAATYSLSENMNVKKIVDILYEGSGKNTNQVRITFKEGLNIRSIATIIQEYTNHTEEEVYEKLQDQAYLNTLIEKYWFIHNDILQSGIYYSLEGYLYPSTYDFSSKEVSIEDIFNTMLEETKKQLAPYQSKIEASNMSIHQILTLASIVELEGVTLEDRKEIAGVFFNRLAKNMALGSDVTTYYGAKVNIGERDLYKSEVSACNNYNTRCTAYVELPVSPICNPSIDAIIAVLEPTESNNYYFVADKNKKVYFSKNITEHNNTIKKLKEEGLWYEY